ncbi:MAG: SGNH/GDSL hydrolase family protein [Actinobacteria bacterium]|nr:MAG: SGNH/GDSL hydrolase family protein [Actinomycetota bacterium]
MSMAVWPLARPGIGGPMHHLGRIAVRPVAAGAIVCVLVGIAILAVAGGAAARSAPGAGPGARYLALGDSVTFGYEESQVKPAPDYTKASTFRAYPDDVGAALHLRVTNAACPGETTSSLINANGPSYGCENSPPPNQNVGYRRFFPLHVSYKGSQLSFAVKFLKKHPGTRLVSLMVGANDLFRCQKTTSDACLSKSEQQATLKTIKRNVHHILSAIRDKADYEGQLVLVHYYSIDYTSALFTGIVRALNRTIDAAGKGFHVATADGFGEFRRGSAHSGGSACKAGLLTQLSNGSCGVHPSYSGHGLLGLAVERIVKR